jgi:hypothetical protein
MTDRPWRGRRKPKVGFWHTGYMEFHEDDFFSAAFPSTRAPRQPPAVPCPDCGLTFPTVQDLELHRFNGHPFIRPTLLLRGRECGRSRLIVAEPTAESDWSVLGTKSVIINGRQAEPSKVGAGLSVVKHGVAHVVLANEKSKQEFDLRFAIADPSDLAGVDGRLHEMVHRHQLTIAVIEGFLAATTQFVTAADYRDGIATYLYGVLARERSPESGLEYGAYREKFDEAVSLLGGFDRIPADVICGLVAFHYNQFDHAILRAQSPRVAWASGRLMRLLGGEDLTHDDVVAPERSSLDFVLSDAATEQVLSWCCIPLDGSAGAAIEDMEASLNAQEPSDQLKLRVIAAEHHLRTGANERARSHVNELRNNAAAEAWARACILRMRREGK